MVEAVLYQRLVHVLRGEADLGEVREGAEVGAAHLLVPVVQHRHVGGLQLRVTLLY